MDKISFGEALISKCKAFGATSAEVMLGESAEISVNCRNGKLEDIERSESSGIGLRVFVGKKSATISSSKFNEVDSLAERAVAMAKAVPEDEFIALAQKENLSQDEIDLDLHDENEPDAKYLAELAKEAEDAAISQPGVNNSEGGDASFSSYTTVLMTSNGFSKLHKSSRCGISVRVLAGEGTEMQRDYDYTSARFMEDLKSPAEIGESAARRVLQKLNPRKISTGKFPVIFDPRVSRNFVSDLANGINAASVARGTSFLKSKIGEQIFSKGMNVVDNPHIKRGLGSKPFDAEGVKNPKLLVIEDGILKCWLMDIRSANQLKLVTNGRASRGIGSNPSPSATNFYMEAGKNSSQELMADIKNGLYVTEAFGMGINYVTGDYSQGASGFIIENGQLAYPVNEVTLAGNLLDIFSNLIPANDLEFKYATNAPTIRVEGMTIAGK